MGGTARHLEGALSREATLGILVIRQWESIARRVEQSALQIPGQDERNTDHPVRWTPPEDGLLLD